MVGEGVVHVICIAGVLVEDMEEGREATHD